MPFGFAPKPPKDTFSLGVDLGTYSVKAVKLKMDKDSIKLIDFKIESTPVDLTALLKKWVQAFGVKKINLAISGSSSIIRYIPFPKMNPAELKQAMKFEAEKHIPFALTEVNLDSFILKQDLPDNKMLVLLSAAKKEVINQRVKMAEEAELKINCIDIDSLALINAFNYSYIEQSSLGKTVALFNIGATLSNLNILEEGIPRLSRDIHIAGNNFTQKISDMLNIDFQAAEKAKLVPLEDKKEKITAAIEVVLANFASEIRTSFDYYESQNASTVSKIFLSGGGCLFSGLEEKLSALLGIDVVYWNPLEKIAVVDNLKAMLDQKILSQIALATGLAIRQ